MEEAYPGSRVPTAWETWSRDADLLTSSYLVWDVDGNIMMMIDIIN